MENEMEKQEYLVMIDKAGRENSHRQQLGRAGRISSQIMWQITTSTTQYKYAQVPRKDKATYHVECHSRLDLISSLSAAAQHAGASNVLYAQCRVHLPKTIQTRLTQIRVQRQRKTYVFNNTLWQSRIIRTKLSLVQKTTGGGRAGARYAVVSFKARLRAIVNFGNARSILNFVRSVLAGRWVCGGGFKREL